MAQDISELFAQALDRQRSRHEQEQTRDDDEQDDEPPRRRHGTLRAWQGRGLVGQHLSDVVPVEGLDAGPVRPLPRTRSGPGPRSSAARTTGGLVISGGLRHGSSIPHTPLVISP